MLSIRISWWTIMYTIGWVGVVIGRAAFYAWARAKHFGCHYPRVGVSKRGYSSRPVCE